MPPPEDRRLFAAAVGLGLWAAGVPERGAGAVAGVRRRARAPLPARRRPAGRRRLRRAHGADGARAARRRRGRARPRRARRVDADTRASGTCSTTSPSWPSRSRTCAARSVHAARGPTLYAVKKRLDVLLVERGLAESASQAQALVMAGRVPRLRQGRGAGRRGRRARARARRRASSPAAGEKLAHALDASRRRPGGRDCLDVGASTGGFTDVPAPARRARVIALDVGYGQLAPAAARRPARDRARAHERARRSTELPFAPELVVCDVSFISRAHRAAAGARARRARLGGARPRQAAVRGRPRRGRRGGVVRDPEVHRASCCARWPRPRSPGAPSRVGSRRLRPARPEGEPGVLPPPRPTDQPDAPR